MSTRLARPDATVAMASPGAQATTLHEIESQIHSLLQSMQQEGIMDEQFEQLILLQDEAEPDFVQTVMDLFFQDSMVAIQRIHAMLCVDAPDYSAIDQVVHQLKGSSASFGAQGVSRACEQLRAACRQGDRAAAQALLETIGRAHQQVQARLQAFTQLEGAKKALQRRA